MPSLKELQLTPVVDLAPYLENGQLMTFGIGPEGNPYIAINCGREAESAGMTLQATQEARVLVLQEGAVLRDVIIPNAPSKTHMIQPLPEGVLLVCASADYLGPEGFAPNGFLLDWEGQPLRSLVLEDALMDVQTTSSGVIWTSFFDEGVFGSAGPARSGLVAWNSQGKPIYEFAASKGLEYIADCYALNVESDEYTWCYYYTQFPLVRLRHYTIDRWWSAPLAGSSAFAVAGHHALFQGGYHNHYQYFLYSLEKAKPALLHPWEFRTPEGERIKADGVRGRGDALWILSDNRIYTARISQLLG